MEQVAVLGAGLLGSGFVERLLQNGMAVRVWNRTPSKVAALVELGATLAASPGEAVAGASRVHLVLAEDTAVDAVIAAFQDSLGEGVPVFDHSTNLPAKVGPRFTRLRADGVRYMHCPVFMGPANARKGTGIMLIAGPQPDVDAFTDTLTTMTGTVWHVGERPDLAAIHKLLGNQLLISITGILGDSVVLAQSQGLDTDAVNELLKHFNPANMLPWMIQRMDCSDEASASFTLEMARKDVRLMIETGGDALCVLPAVAARMDEVIAEGGGAKDYAFYAKPQPPAPTVRAC